jgi:hypothetical protein
MQIMQIILLEILTIQISPALAPVAAGSGSTNPKTVNPVYDTRFYIYNNITGTGNVLQDEAYNAICSQMDCVCCVGHINSMRCGIDIICSALQESIPKGTGVGWSVVIYILCIYAVGFKTMGLGLRMLTENKNTSCCVWTGYIVLIIGVLGSFPLGLFILICLAKKIEFPSLKCCKCCRKCRKKAKPVEYEVPELYYNNPNAAALPNNVVMGELGKRDIAVRESIAVDYVKSADGGNTGGVVEIPNNDNKVTMNEGPIVGEKENIEMNNIIIDNSVEDTKKDEDINK